MEVYYKAAIRAMREYGLEKQAKVSLIQLSENASYLITEKQSGRKLGVLRICRPGYHTFSQLKSELKWLERIRQDISLTVPKPVKALNGKAIQAVEGIDGKSYFCILFEFIEGKQPDIENEQEAVRCFLQLGKVTACLHKQSKEFPEAESLNRIQWDYHTIIGRNPAWGAWQDVPNLRPEWKALLSRTAAVIEKRLQAYGKNRQNYGLIHADLRLANLLAEKDKLHVIDFDDCGFGWYLHDMASAFSFMETRPIVPKLISCWLEGYQQVLPLTDRDRKEIDTFIMQRRIQLTAWMASHPDSDPAKEFGEGYIEGTVWMAERYMGRFG
ncbi:MAG: phosphotransferase [Roseburia sp.]|nr:phosphotransferase [Roseburia sp.]MCM1278199.1 phosphotransferase [Robinsoniella sp.]